MYIKNESLTSLTNLIKGNKVQFDSYRAGFFYYNIPAYVEDSMGVPDIYQFTVPVEDIGNATLLASDKAITFMRWIRKAMDSGTLTKIR